MINQTINVFALIGVKSFRCKVVDSRSKVLFVCKKCVGILTALRSIEKRSHMRPNRYKQGDFAPGIPCHNRLTKVQTIHPEIKWTKKKINQQLELKIFSNNKNKTKSKVKLLEIKLIMKVFIFLLTKIIVLDI